MLQSEAKTKNNKKPVLNQNPNRKSDFMLFDGRNRIRFPYSRYGYTRGNGKVWHGGVDVDGLDDSIIHFPTYHNKSISGTVVTARIVTDKRNRTWEWGYYDCVKMDAKQTPDAVNYLYFCHCDKILVNVGQKVKSGDPIAVMGNTCLQGLYHWAVSGSMPVVPDTCHPLNLADSTTFQNRFIHHMTFPTDTAK